MAGLIEGRLRDRVAGRDDRGDGVVPDEDELPNASPEEQAAYDRIVDSAFRILYEGGQVRPAILELLDDDPADLKALLGDALPLDAPDPHEPGRTLWQAQGPVIALAAAAVIVLIDALRRLDERPEGYIVLRAGEEIIEDLAEIARLAGRRAYSREELSEALRKGADLFREAGAAAGLVDEEAAKGEWDEIVEADREGRAGALLGRRG